VRQHLGSDADRLMPHFSPNYNPWDQRVCVTLDDNNIFQVLRERKADIVTDKIKCFDKTGIQLESGERIDCDIIVTATGLQLMFRGGIDIEVNGKPAPMSSDTIWYRACLCDMPNAFFSAGFFYGSWTLRAEPSVKWAAGLIRHMREHKKDIVVPRISDEKRKLAAPFHKMTSGYLERGRTEYPMQSVYPYSWYKYVVFEWALFNLVPYTWDGALQFSNVDKKQF
jgi:cation diffusion facilitator CzcD-associated flavoprotein CzcO